jgi:hypothetical protein
MLCAERSRWAYPADLKRCIWRSRRWVGRWEFSARLFKYRWFCQLSRSDCRPRPADAVDLRCGENGEGNCHATEMQQATAVGGDILVVVSTGAVVGFPYRGE